MASIISTIGIQVKTMGATNAANKMRLMNASVLKLSATMAVFNAGTMIGLNALEKLGEVIKDSIKFFREFEMRMAEVGTILSEDYNQIERLTKGVERLSIEFGQSTSDMAKGLYDILSAAFTARDALNLLNTSTKASIAGLSTVRESVDIFTTVLNTYGMTASQAARVSDVLFQSVVRGKFQFKDLESSLGYVVPIAAQAGIVFDELMAALSTATRHGLHLDMTARGLALAIQNIINPTESAAKAAAKYEIDMSALAIRAYGLTGFFEDLNEATKIYGSTIISELIPNMRSMRVAMVLAGDEGLAGLTEDMGLLEEATGRTDEALKKIMETQQFAADVLGQRYEKIERGWGEFWGQVGLDIKGGLLDFGASIERGFNRWKNFIMWGKFVDELPVKDEYKDTGLKPSTDKYGNAQLYLETLDAQEKLSESYITGKLSEEEYISANEKLNEIIKKTEESFNFVTGEIEGFNDELFAANKLIADAENELKELSVKLYDVYEWGTKLQGSTEGTLFYKKELLEAERDHALLLHDIQMGLAGTGYQYDIINQEVQDAIKYINEWEDAQKQARKETERYNESLRINNLEIMKLQLVGMMRRRGLSRGQEKRMKQLRIDSMRTRIESEENIEHKTEAEKQAYEDAKQVLEDYKLKSNEILFQMKFNYKEQIDALDQTILDETDRYKTRTQMIKDANDDIIAINEATHLALMNIWSRPELSSLLVAGGYGWAASTLPPIMKLLFPGGVPGLPSEPWKGIPFKQGGTHFLPETGLYYGHKGEQIIPRGGKTRGGANVTINIPVKIGTVASDVDIDKLASQIAFAVKAEYMNSDGTYNYDLR